MAVARLLPGSQLDPSFAPGSGGDDLDDADGRLEISYGGWADTGTDGARDVLVQPDGTIVVAGFAIVPEGGSAVVTQLGASGAITGFGNVFIGFNGGAGARAVARQADGRLVVAGITAGANGSDIAVARIPPDTGQPDTPFSPGGADGDGRLVLDLGGSDVAEDALVQPDGKIVLAGRQTINTQDILAARLDADGSRDPSFDGDGLALVDVADSESGNAVALQADGKIVVAGSVDVEHALVRLQPGGSLDTTFSGDGRQRWASQARPGEPRPRWRWRRTAACDGRLRLVDDEDVAVARLQGEGADVIAGLGGNDTVTALGGNDVVCGGPGRDLLKGGPGWTASWARPGATSSSPARGRATSAWEGPGRDAAACERGEG